MFGINFTERYRAHSVLGTPRSLAPSTLLAVELYCVRTKVDRGLCDLFPFVLRSAPHLLLFNTRYPDLIPVPNYIVSGLPLGHS